jgi:hypothetical protein
LKLAILIAAAGACGDEPLSSDARRGLEIPDQVVLNVESATLDALGQTLALEAKVLDASGREIAGATVAWELQDSSIVSVDANGVVTALANGYTPVRARVTNPVVGEPGVSSEANVTVEQAVSELSFSAEGLRLEWLGSQVGLVVEGRDREGHVVEREFEAEWSSSDPEVVLVDEGSGLVTAVGDGAATVEVRVDEATASLPVEVDTALRLAACAVTGFDDPRAASPTSGRTSASNPSNAAESGDETGDSDGCGRLELQRRR